MLSIDPNKFSAYLARDGLTPREVAKKYNVAPRHVYPVCPILGHKSGGRWKLDPAKVAAWRSGNTKKLQDLCSRNKPMFLSEGAASGQA